MPLPSAAHLAASGIVLVEDNPNDAEMALRALRKNLHVEHVQWIKDGVEALDYFFRESAPAADFAPRPLRLVLLDLKLPLVDGHEVLARLKQDPRTRKIPVVVLTSSHEERDIERCYAAGANSYVVKPLDFDGFMQTLSELGRYWLNLNQVAGI